MGIIINYLKKNKIKTKEEVSNFFQKKLQKQKTQNKNNNKKLNAQNKNKKLFKTKKKTQNQKKSKKKQRRTHLRSTSPKICSRCPNFKKQEKRNCHFFETLKEVPIS